MSVCPSVVITIASERKELWTSNFANRLLAIGRLVLKIGPQDLGHMECPIRTKFDIDIDI